MSELPTGTVTFLFTDIEGSTRLLQELGDDYGDLQGRHTRILQEAVSSERGRRVRTEGDAFFAVFRTPSDAVRASVAGQRGLAAERWPHGRVLRVRMGMHTGEGSLAGGDYIGLDVHLAARIAAAGHGGQVLLSDATRALVERTLPEGVAVRDLGQQALKDFDEPQHLHDLVIDGIPADHPPLRTTIGPRRSNLPVPRTSFVGRDRELDEISALLAGARLLTLTGPGGAGKTRLAVRAAADHVDRTGGDVHFVDLSGVRDATAVAGTVAASLGVRDAADPVEALVHHLSGRELLILVDNFEQVADAAPVLDRLLHAVPGLRVLATSRRPLRLSGEQEYQIGPLPLPAPGGTDLDELTASESVRLFATRAAAVLPDFALTEENAPAVAEIARRLDGLPLAIELAATRVKLMGPRELVQRMDHRLPLLTGGPRDVPERQRTLRAAIEWSHDLLEPGERRLLERLSVFRTGWQLASAEVVCGPGLGIDVLSALDSLVDRSLVRHAPTARGEVRFSMLETIHEFATERLNTSGEAEDIRRRHAEFVRDLAEEAEPHFRTEEQARWLDRMEDEHDNVRAALDWAVGSGDAETAMRVGAALWRFWHFRGPLAEARDRLERIVAMPGAQADTAHRVRALGALGGVAYWQRDYPATAVRYEEAVTAAREIGDRRLLSRALYDWSFIPLVLEQDVQTQERRLREALDVAAEDDRMLHADILLGLGYIPMYLGDWQAGVEPIEQALAICREVGDRMRLGEILAAISVLRLKAGDVDDATRNLHDAVGIQMASRSPAILGIAMAGLAVLEARTGDAVAAARLLGAWARIKDEGAGSPPPFGLTFLGEPEAVTRAAIGDDAFDRAHAEGYAMTVEQARAYTQEVLALGAARIGVSTST